jgi:hypothetical protein
VKGLTCKQCCIVIIPAPDIEAIYANQSLCMICRKKNGQKTFTQAEQKALDGEEIMAKSRKARMLD